MGTLSGQYLVAVCSVFAVRFAFCYWESEQLYEVQMADYYD